MRIFCGKKPQNFASVELHFWAKKQNFAQLSAIVISFKISLHRICTTLFCAIAFAQLRLRNCVCAITLFRNVHTINDTSLFWKLKSASHSPCLLGLTYVRLFISNLYWLQICGFFIFTSFCLNLILITFFPLNYNLL